MHDITGKKIAILATDGFEQSEMMVPKRKLEDAGAEVEIVSLKPGEIWGWQHGNWGDAVPVDKTLDGVSVEDYDALVLPGGQINPDLLRDDKRAVAFVRDFYADVVHPADDVGFRLESLRRPPAAHAGPQSPPR